jgi:hypothetical protein
MTAEPENISATEAPEKEKNWLEIAEVRMVLYVVPAGIILAIIGYVLSRFTK